MIEAELTRDTERFGKMDPYVKFSYGELEFRTTEKTDAGKNPIWNETFQIDVIELEDEMSFSVMDANAMSDDVVGEATIAFN